MKGNSTSQSSWCSSSSAGDLREELFDKVLFHWHHKYKILTPVDKVFPVHSALSLPCLLIAVCLYQLLFMQQLEGLYLLEYVKIVVSPSPHPQC